MLQFGSMKYDKVEHEVRNMKENLYRLGSVILGNILIAFAVSTLILENNIIAGGASGIGIVLQHYFGISVSLSVAIINVILFVLGFLFIGKVFAMTTLISTFIFPILLEFFSSCQILHGYLNDPLLSCILAGCLIGVGIGLVLKNNASTGGIDVLALLIHNHFKIPVHIVLNIFDLIILLLQFTCHLWNCNSCYNISHVK